VVDDTPRVLGGRYEVGELIGRGGMAEVHIGHDARLSRTVAIKILRSDLARDPSFQARFRREAQSAAALNHPAIVAVYDTGEDVTTEPGGSMVHVPYIVMEYVEGHTVRDILRGGAAVPIDEAIEITSGVLSALEYSHRAGIVHRDIKPGNIMITTDGSVKVMDFGIARAMADSQATMTSASAVVGTAQYLSPEQARGEAVDFRSDLYSTGCLLFELLTGQPPFQGESAVAVAYQHVRETPPEPSSISGDIPPSLDQIVAKALTKEMGDRYQTASAFRTDLEAAGRGEPLPSFIGAAPLSSGPAPEVPPVDDSATTAMAPVDVAPDQGIPPPIVQPAAQFWPPVDPPATDDAPATRRELREQEPQGSRIWLWILLAVVGLGALFGLYKLFAGNAPAEPDQVSVPSVVNMTAGEAESALQEVNLIYREATENSVDVEEGHATRSVPPAGELVDPQTEVTVYISTGPQSLQIPDVKNLDQQTATRTLTELGFVVAPGATTGPDPQVEQDKVISTVPPAGEFADEGTTVTLHVSNGRVLLDDLKNMTLEAAQAKLTELGLSSAIEHEENDSVAPNVVLRTTPPPGEVPQHSTVTLVLAQTPAPVMVAIPDVIDDQASAAAGKLQAVGLTYTLAYEYHSEIENGRVIRTEPHTGAEVAPGSVVTLVISNGPMPPPPSPTPTPDPTPDPTPTP
jgi:beta-lactam-binding protein with PASTA domain/serine/threonine protein kinase